MKVITPYAILSYPTLVTPKANEQGKLKYSATLVFLKGTDLTELKKAAVEAGIGKFTNAIKTPGGVLTFVDAVKNKVLKWPFRDDAIAKGYPEGAIFFSTNSEQRPGLALNFNDPTTGKVAICPEDKIMDYFYPGSVVRAVLNAYGYDNKSRGVTFGLQHLQFVRHGDRLDNRTAAQDEFSALEETPGGIDAALAAPTPDINSLI
jgi:hypothetical protein